MLKHFLIVSLVAIAGYFAFQHFRPSPLTLSDSGNVQKAAYYLERGGPEHVYVGSALVDDSPLGEMDVVIKVAFVSLNPADWKMLEMPPLLCNPRAPSKACGVGLDGSGVVEAVGSAVTRIKVGDRVVFGLRGGTLQTRVRVTQDAVGVIPERWSLRSASTMFVVGLTSLRALLDECDVATLTPDDTVLVTGGGSITGQMGLQIASHLSPARLVAYCGNETACKKWGARDVINYHKETLENGLRRLKVLSSLAVVYEAVSEDTTWNVVTSKSKPCVVSIDAGKNPLKFIWNLISRKVMSLLGAGSPYYFFINNPDAHNMDRLASYMGQGVLRAPDNLIEFPFTTQGVRDGLLYVKSGKGGKVVIRVGEKK